MNSSEQGCVLIVEDDPKTAAILRLYLNDAGFETVEAADGAEALVRWRRRRPDFILLDWMIPRLNGIEICRTIRAASDVPIIMISAKIEEEDRLKGLWIGADDYVVKPFSPREVIARIHAILRRARPADAGRRPVFASRGLLVDPEKHRVTIGGQPVALTHSEFQLLSALIAAPGRVYSREALLHVLYPNGEARVLDRTIDVHIRNLREKIEADPSRPAYVRTVRGIGYRFAEEEALEAV